MLVHLMDTPGGLLWLTRVEPAVRQRDLLRASVAHVQVGAAAGLGSAPHKVEHVQGGLQVAGAPRGVRPTGIAAAAAAAAAPASSSSTTRAGQGWQERSPAPALPTCSGDGGLVREAMRSSWPAAPLRLSVG